MASRRLTDLAGIGFVFTENDPYTGVDLDDAIDIETGELKPWAERIVKRLDSYTEISPSGQGVKIFIRAAKPGNPQSMVHLTEKPVELAKRAIEYSSLAGHNVLDLFGGSGSTLMGCEQTGRRAFLMELDQAYADIIVKRWEQFTGKQAQRIPAATEKTPASAGVEEVEA